MVLDARDSRNYSPFQPDTRIRKMSFTPIITLLPTLTSFACRVEESVLDGMRRAGLQGIPVGCRGGGCGVCRIHVLEGQFSAKRMSRAHVSEQQEQGGDALACRVFAQTDLRIEVTGGMGRKVRWGATTPV